MFYFEEVNQRMDVLLFVQIFKLNLAVSCYSTKPLVIVNPIWQNLFWGKGCKQVQGCHWRKYRGVENSTPKCLQGCCVFYSCMCSACKCSVVVAVRTHACTHTCTCVSVYVYMCVRACVRAWGVGWEGCL